MLVHSVVAVIHTLAGAVLLGSVGYNLLRVHPRGPTLFSGRGGVRGVQRGGEAWGEGEGAIGDGGDRHHGDRSDGGAVAAAGLLVVDGACGSEGGLFRGGALPILLHLLAALAGAAVRR